MPSSLFHLCGGFIVVMGVPGLSAVDLQLLQRINESAGQLPVRVLLKGLDSSISQAELLEYSMEVLSEVQNEIYVVTDDNFDQASRLIDSFSISYFDHPNDAREVSQLVVKMVFAQISEVLNTRDELNEIVAPKSLLKNLPPEKRKKALRKEKINDYKSELYAWKITNNELRSDIGLCDNEVRQAESNIRKHKHAPVPGFFFDIFASSAAQNRYRAVENSLNAKLSTAKTNASTARKLYENHQNLKPNRPL
jgi:hypothetical protein